MQGPRGGRGTGLGRGAGVCVCVRCNKEYPHTPGQPCRTQTCPICGSRLVRGPARW